MAVSQAEGDRRVALMVRALRDAGLRLTHQRLEVVREIAASEEHPDVESIYSRVQARVPTISLDTVYRTLATLADQGLIVRVAASSGRARYDANTTRHHHFVCIRCGLIRDVSDPQLDAVRAPQSVAALGRVESVDVQLRGVCAACTRHENDQPKGAAS